VEGIDCIWDSLVCSLICNHNHVLSTHVYVHIISNYRSLPHCRLKVHVVPSRKTSTSLVFQFRCLDVKNIESGMLGFGKTDPYVEIAKVYNYPDIGTKHVQAVYRSEVIPNHLNPFYEKAAINFEELCDGDQNMPLLISIWDYSSRKRTLVGALETDTENLLAAVAEGNGDKSRALRFVTMGFRKTHVVAHLVVLEARLIDE
jgi:hypothetical protein